MNHEQSRLLSVMIKINQDAIKINFDFSKYQAIDGKISPDEYEYVQVAKNIVNGLGFWSPERGGELYFSEPVHPLIMSIIF